MKEEDEEIIPLIKKQKQLQQLTIPLTYNNSLLKSIKKKNNNSDF